MTAPALAQGDVRLLQTEVAQRLLTSKELARLAYTGRDGKPRVLPMMFHFNGTEVVFASFAGALKIAALRERPDVAITIDTSVHPPEILMIRGTATLTEVEGVAEEFVLANQRYGGPEFGAKRIAEVNRPGVRMVRIAVRPQWVGVLDFTTRFSGGRDDEEFARRGR
ncbi:pyridoxamine 5'-phosphate oxidase family protein [Actinoplanes sp. N902-109]|uniref:pyridoxamine 5'-phosphate oxidase family protein n=1 Tax=Actinoplanes sp. (strain N902-109) TaxID=649831 RepID=UPI000329346B|nr:pyridoxamine 5'-phosphate oxidase family protein [Actinoplanes sp. N902-109]AGL16731.1 pyridoxamine 5'-phosphate oxidase-related FMN-binding protein [Actinoplanes sp. N902-109]